MNLDQIIAVVLALLPLIPLPLILKHVLDIKSRLIPAADAEKVKSLVRTAVEAVEQTCAAMQGPDKKSEAVRLIGTLLNEHGLKVSPTMLDTLISQAVYRMNQGVDPQATSLSIPIPGK